MASRQVSPGFVGCGEPDSLGSPLTARLDRKETVSLLLIYPYSVSSSLGSEGLWYQNIAHLLKFTGR